MLPFIKQVRELAGGEPQAVPVLERGLNSGEEGLLESLTSEDAHLDVQLNPNYEDAGYQVYLLAKAIASGDAVEYVSRFKEYRTWLVKQNDDPWFYWNSKRREAEDGVPLDLLISSYARYRAEEKSISLLKEIRARASETLELQSAPPSRLDLVEKSQTYEAEVEVIDDTVSQERLLEIASGIAKMRGKNGGKISIHKFGSIASIMESILYFQLRACTTESDKIGLILEHFPCLSPVMDSDLHCTIVKDAVAGSNDPSLLLSALLKYETILRDMMEEEGVIRVANIYAIGRKTCKNYNRIPMNEDRICDILSTERLRLRCLEKQYEWRARAEEASGIDKAGMLSIERYMFLSAEHTTLLRGGAIDNYDYHPLRDVILVAGRQFLVQKGGIHLLEELVSAVDEASWALTLGIEECLRSIGTDNLKPVRLIER